MPSSLFAFVFVLLVALAFIAFKLRQLREETEPGKESQDCYELRRSLFTPAERSFYGVLTTLDLDGVTILCKVRLEDVFAVKAGLERPERQRARNRISSRHVDFLLIQSSDGRPLIGIELDDRSHEREDRQARDAFVDSLFEGVGIPLLHVPAKAAYEPRELQRRLDAAFERV